MRMLELPLTQSKRSTRDSRIRIRAPGRGGCLGIMKEKSERSGLQISDVAAFCVVCGPVDWGELCVRSKSRPLPHCDAGAPAVEREERRSQAIVGGALRIVCDACPLRPLCTKAADCFSARCSV